MDKGGLGTRLAAVVVSTAIRINLHDFCSTIGSWRKDVRYSCNGPACDIVHDIHVYLS